ncbi:MAG: glycosyltransferase family 2 protein, partial [Candidatus Methanomethylicia archaeon]
NPILTFILNLLFNAGVSDAHSGFRAIRRDALERLSLKSHGMEFASEMILKASLMGLRIREVPITYYPRRGGKSKLKSLRDGWRHLKFMLLYAPSSLYAYPGLSLSIIGLLLMLFGYFEVYIGYTPGLHSMILGSFCLLTGFQLIFLSLFAWSYGAKYRSSKFMNSVLKHLKLERGILIGLVALLMAIIYLTILFINWLNSGFTVLPLRGEDIIAFTSLTLGLQIIFNSILISGMTEK